MKILFLAQLLFFSCTYYYRLDEKNWDDVELSDELKIGLIGFYPQCNCHHKKISPQNRGENCVVNIESPIKKETFKIFELSYSNSNFTSNENKCLNFNIALDKKNKLGSRFEEFKIIPSEQEIDKKKVSQFINNYVSKTGVSGLEEMEDFVIPLYDSKEEKYLKKYDLDLIVIGYFPDDSLNENIYSAANIIYNIFLATPTLSLFPYRMKTHKSANFQIYDSNFNIVQETYSLSQFLKMKTIFPIIPSLYYLLDYNNTYQASGKYIAESKKRDLIRRIESFSSYQDDLDFFNESHFKRLKSKLLKIQRNSLK